MPNGIAKPALLALLSLACHQGQAADLTCGVYQDHKNEEYWLLIDSADQAHEVSATAAPRRFEYRRAGNVLQMADLEAGYVTHYKIDGKDRIADDLGFHDYVLTEPEACGTMAPPAAAGTCRADLPACLERAYDADEVTLRRWCEVESLPFACDKLIDLYKTQTQAAPEARPGIATPPVCEVGTPAFSEAQCLAAVKELVGKQMATDLAGVVISMYADAPPLPAARLDQAAAMCSGGQSAKVCDKAAEVLWNAGRYLQARAALQSACTQGDPEACKKVLPLWELTEKDERFVPAIALPCGAYVAATGLMSELKFVDRGMVEGGFGSRMRARLEQGLVRVRHNKGGDFVFRVLDGQRLLGLDSWNRYAVYQRQGDAGTCSAPVTYVEKPLEMDCPAILEDGGAQRCCDAGKLQGCNGLGHQRALQGDWQGARPYYLKICAAGVRTGCENLVQVYANAGDESVIGSLDKLCDGDPSHVACDVRETSNFEMLGMADALQQLGGALEAGLAEDDANMDADAGAEDDAEVNASDDADDQ